MSKVVVLVITISLLMLSTPNFMYAQDYVRKHYDKAIDSFSLAETHYNELKYSKANDYYEDAEREAQYSREAENLTDPESGKMLDIIHKSRDGERQAYDKMRELNDLAKQHKVKLGMTKEQVIESLGRPRHINRTIVGNGTTEQWCYGDSLSGTTEYGYFDEDGILTGWQD